MPYVQGQKGISYLSSVQVHTAYCMCKMIVEGICGASEINAKLNFYFDLITVG